MWKAPYIWKCFQKQPEEMQVWYFSWTVLIFHTLFLKVGNGLNPQESHLQIRLKMFSTKKNYKWRWNNTKLKKNISKASVVIQLSKKNTWKKRRRSKKTQKTRGVWDNPCDLWELKNKSKTIQKVNSSIPVIKKGTIDRPRFEEEFEVY